MFKLVVVGLLAFGAMFVSQSFTAEESKKIIENFDLSKVYDMPWTEVQKNFESIIATMKKENFNCIKYFPKSEFVRFSLTATHGENTTFMLERWNNALDYFLDPGCMEHFKLYILDRFPITRSTWWGPIPSWIGSPNDTDK